MRGEFAKEQVRLARCAAEELWEALPARKRVDFLPQMNLLYQFFGAAQAAAPEQERTAPEHGAQGT